MARARRWHILASECCANTLSTAIRRGVRCSSHHTGISDFALRVRLPQHKLLPKLSTHKKKVAVLRSRQADVFDAAGCAPLHRAQPRAMIWRRVAGTGILCVETRKHVEPQLVWKQRAGVLCGHIYVADSVSARCKRTKKSQQL
jgi:hypothetical protein